MKTENNIPEIDIVFKKKIKSDNLPHITSSSESHQILRNVWSDKIELYEEFLMLLLNNANRCLGWIKISQGGITGTIVETKLIVAIAIKAAATGVILAHNHPSGNVKPSLSDLNCTKKLKECCKLFDIELIDHIILSGDTNAYYSFSDEGEI